MQDCLSITKANKQHSGDASELYLVEAWLRYDERWSTSTLFQVKDHAQDHLACTLVDEREATKPLSRAELYSLLSLIQQGLKRSKSARNIPVSYIHAGCSRQGLQYIIGYGVLHRDYQNSHHPG